MPTRYMRKKAYDTRRMATLEKFLQLKPPYFEGKPDPSTAEMWLKSIKEKFDTLDVPPNYRMQFATFLFEGNAEAWWDLMEDDHDVENMNWDQFEQFFQENFVTVDNHLSTISEVFLDENLGPFKFSKEKKKIKNGLVTRKSQNQLQGSQGNGTSCGGSGFSGSGRYSPYSCYNCNQQGHLKKACPLRLQQSPLSLKGSLGSPSGSVQLEVKTPQGSQDHKQLEGSLGSGITSGSGYKTPQGSQYHKKLQKLQDSQGSGKTSGNGNLSEPGPKGSLGCFTCGQRHFKKNCPLRQQKRPQTSQARPKQFAVARIGKKKKKNQLPLQGPKVNGSTNICYKCGKAGHFQRSCRMISSTDLHFP
ncbi:uncharacterized protein LOC133782038 [Humulus lupulus]|uniref:uncharacterized protein LOC133782038 n=1 Tax=Humulus lupulus TaxID=3486 RepID=UPI002B40B1E3|nr:uncharacterized protein LOC133782038 [Humulus lupulus]XP_062077168.1 uncharacterized protein LOC133782038 [Humulus lupulus]XP_062077169.1 uncharacterized protein LOC133782038 [Humulus lupulus]XP_062077170.1 uncharacterized protein LOC133782038 [Humulus lupulus]XP_062077172.1 uncharacterized protein LOC133782038 [Humulus lupulus]XP_062077173.1 uncharacterized protein LOC133782038 [Humulus lupulus]XP_062077174.1 uncharacterized protein LOC133782038 [Humulus lupulus]